MKILCIGDLNADLILPYGDAKRIRDTQSDGVEQAKVTLQGGGTMGNMATVLGKLEDQPIFITDRCADSIGEFVAKELEDVGVDMSYAPIGDNASIVCIAVIDEDHERLIFPWMPPKSTLPRFTKKSFEKLPNDDYIVLVTGMLLNDDQETMDAVINYIRHLKQHTSSKVIFDVNVRIETYGLSSARRQAYDELIGLTDILMGSGIEEFLPLTGINHLEEAAKSLSTTNRIVIARDGAGPTCIVEDGRVDYVDSKKVEVVSTVGAGDTFDACFTHAYRQGKSIKDCVTYATECAAYMISHEGRLTLPHEDHK